MLSAIIGYIFTCGKGEDSPTASHCVQCTRYANDAGDFHDDPGARDEERGEDEHGIPFVALDDSGDCVQPIYLHEERQMRHCHCCDALI